MVAITIVRERSRMFLAGMLQRIAEEFQGWTLQSMGDAFRMIEGLEEMERIRKLADGPASDEDKYIGTWQKRYQACAAGVEAARGFVVGTPLYAKGGFEHIWYRVHDDLDRITIQSADPDLSLSLCLPNLPNHKVLDITFRLSCEEDDYKHKHRKGFVRAVQGVKKWSGLLWTKQEESQLSRLVD